MMKNSIPKDTEALISEAEKSNQLTKFHKKFDTSKPSKRLKVIESMDIKKALLNTGSCVVYDSRTHHCGTANNSCKTRRIFYFWSRKRFKAYEAG